MAQERKDIITDEALMAPLVMAQHLEKEYEWLMKVSKAGREASTAVDQSESTKKLKDDISKLTVEQSKLLKVQTDLASVSQKTIAANKAEVEALNANRVSYAALRTEEERRTVAGQQLLKTMQDQILKLKEADAGTKTHVNTLSGLKKELKAAKDSMVDIAHTLGEDSKEFREAALHAGELSDKIGDISEASKAVSGDNAFQKLGDQFGLFSTKLKGLDFKGAATQLNSIRSTVGTIDLKTLSSGLGALSKSFAALGAELLLNPLFWIPAIIVLVGLAINALKDKLFPLIKAFEAMSAAVDWVVQKLEDFSDAMGWSAFASQKLTDKILEDMLRVQKGAAQSFDYQKKLLDASGRSTYEVELKKQKMFEETAHKSIAALEANVKNRNKLDQKAWDEQVKIMTDAQVEQRALRIAHAKIVSEDEHKVSMQRFDNEIKTQEAIAASEGQSYKKRIAATIAAEKLRTQKIEEERRHALSNVKGEDASERIAINEKANADILASQKKGADDQRNLLIKQSQEEKAIHEEMANNEKATFEQRVKAMADAMNSQHDILTLQLEGQLLTQQQYDKAVEDNFAKTTDRIIALTLDRQQRIGKAMKQEESTGQNNRLDELEVQLMNEEITYKKYLKEKQKLQDQGQADALSSQLDFLNEGLEMLKKFGLDTTAMEEAVSAAQLAVDENKNKNLIEAKAKTQDALKELQTTGVQGVLEIIDNFNEAADMRRQEETERIETQLANDLELVGSNEEAKALLVNDAAIAKDKIRREQAAADRKRAIFEKATAAVSIAINTAKGIGEALGYGPPGIVLAAIIAALGAIQVGVVLSKPIPSYARGTGDHRGGAARVGEEGRELIIEPSGRQYLSPDKESFLNLPAHTKVIPHAETINRLAMNAVGRLDSTIGTADDASSRRVERKLDALNYTMRTKKEVHINYTKAGAEAMFRSAESKIKFLNDFYH